MRPTDIPQQSTTRSHSSDSATIAHEAIAESAYYLWQAQGCPDGNAEAIWLEAEKRLRASISETPHSHHVPEVRQRKRETAPKERTVSKAAKRQRAGQA
jgi:hypothetical protein